MVYGVEADGLEPVEDANAAEPRGAELPTEAAGHAVGDAAAFVE